MSKKHQQLMVREYENAKQSLVEKILKLADCNAQAYKCCHNIRSTKTRIETKLADSRFYIVIRVTI